MSSAQAREPAIGVDWNTSKIPMASSAISGRPDLANVLLADELAKEKEKAEFVVQKDINSTEAEGGTCAFAEYTSEGAKALDLVHPPQKTSEHITADPSTACTPESKGDEPAQAVVEDTTSGSGEATEKGLSAELFKKLNDSESVASKALPANESIRCIQDCSGITSVGQENIAESVGQGAATVTAKACSDGELPVHREAVEAASNRGTVASSSEAHQQCSFPDEDSSLASALKQKSPEEEEAKGHLTANEDSRQSKQFRGEHLPSVKAENSAYVPPEKHNSHTPACVHTATKEISFPPVTTTLEGRLEGEKRKDSVIKSAVTQKKVCQTSHGVDAYDFKEPDGEDAPPIKDLSLEKREGITEADISEEQDEKSQEVREAIEGEQNAGIAKSNVNMEDQREMSQQLPGEKTSSEKPSCAAESNAEKSLDLQTKPGQLEAQNQSSSDAKTSHEVPNEQERTACDPATSSLTASKTFESSPTSNSHEVSQSNVLGDHGDHQEASREVDVNALKSKVDLAEEQNATRSLSSLNLDSDEKLQEETEARNIDSVCDKAARDSLDSGEMGREHTKQAPKLCDSRREYQKPNVDFRDVHGEPVENSESSNRELQDREEGDSGDVIDKDNQNVRALSPLKANELNTKEQVCTESSDEKLLAALDLVPCQESSPSPSNVAVNLSPPPEKLDVEAEKPGPSSAASGSVDKKKQKKEQKNAFSFEKPGPSCPNSDAAERKGGEQEGSSGKKRWSLRTPTKPRKRFIIPDSDDEDFESYGSEDISAETLKSRSEEAFDVLLNVFKTEQAKKAANHAEPTGKKNAKKGGLSSSKRKPSFSKSFGSGDGAAGKEGSTSKTEKFKAKEKPSTRKSHPVDTPSFVTNEAPAPKRAQKRRSEPAKPVACKKSVGGDTTTQTPFIANRIPSLTELFAGDIRIRCQKPSFSNDKAATNYHCSKCGFRSTRMENIVRHHKQDCPYSKSLFEWDTEPSKSTNSNAPT